MIPAVAMGTAFVISLVVCWLVIRHVDSTWLDQPGERSLHTRPVPRLGGLGIGLGIASGSLLCLSILDTTLDGYWVGSALLLWLVALLDDRRSVHFLWRLLVQMLAAILVATGSGLVVEWPTEAIWLRCAVTVLLLVWSINLYNFMDGIDGLAASMAAIGFSTLAVFGLIGGHPAFAVLCGLLVAATAGFFPLNFPPARLFMGDSGSTLLGFAMSTVSIKGGLDGLYHWSVPILVFSPFWMDASVTLLRRLLHGEKVWLPHRQHYYQRWVLAGYSHRAITGVYTLLMLACSATTLAWHSGAGGYNKFAPLVLWGVIYLLGYAISEWQLQDRKH